MLLLSIAAAQQDSVRSGPSRFNCFDVSMNKQVIGAILDGIGNNMYGVQQASGH